MNILSYVTELVKAKISVKIAECNSQISKLSEQEEPQNRVIGFAIPSDEGDIEDDESYE